MIVRIWRGHTPTAKAHAYLDYLTRTGVRDYRRIAGNQGVEIFRRVTAGLAEFVVVSRWDSLEAIRAFAGEDYERARYYPEDEKYLVALEPRVVHYERVLATGVSRAEQSAG